VQPESIVLQPSTTASKCLKNIYNYVFFSLAIIELKNYCATMCHCYTATFGLVLIGFAVAFEIIQDVLPTGLLHLQRIYCFGIKHFQYFSGFSVHALTRNEPARAIVTDKFNTFTLEQ
jgi:hypothetical protein